MHRFGDEGYRLRYGGGDNRAMILFRKGDQFIEVVSPLRGCGKEICSACGWFDPNEIAAHCLILT